MILLTMVMMGLTVITYIYIYIHKKTHLHFLIPYIFYLFVWPFEATVQGKLYGTMDDLRLEHRRVQAKYIASRAAVGHRPLFFLSLS